MAATQRGWSKESEISWGWAGLLAISEETLVSLNIGIRNPKSEKELLSMDSSDSIVPSEVATRRQGWRQSHRGEGDPRPGRRADSVAGGDGGREKEVTAER